VNPVHEEELTPVLQMEAEYAPYIGFSFTCDFRVLGDEDWEWLRLRAVPGTDIKVCAGKVAGTAEITYVDEVLRVIGLRGTA
jgi:hypothetical protein